MPENVRQLPGRSRAKAMGTFSRAVVRRMDTWAAITALALSPESIAALRTGRFPNWAATEVATRNQRRCHFGCRGVLL